MADIYVTTSGNDSTGTGASGSPYATPGKASGVAASGDRIYIKSGTYTLTGSTVNVAGGPLQPANGVGIEGYNTTIGDLGTPPVISAGAIGSITVIDLVNSGPTAINWCTNVKVDGNSQSSVVGFSDASTYGVQFFRCIAVNCTTGFANLIQAVFCATDNCGTGFDGSHGNGLVAYCYAKGGTTGFNTQVGMIGCIADSPSGNGFRGLYGKHYAGCTAYGCGGDGFSSDYGLICFENNVAVNCGGYGFNTGGNAPPIAVSNAFYNNTSGNWRTTPIREIGSITLTGVPFTNASGHDFSLNATSGQGAALRAAGIPGAYPVASTTGYLDIGAVQHQDGGGGGGGGSASLLTGPGMTGGMGG